MLEQTWCLLKRQFWSRLASHATGASADVVLDVTAHLGPEKSILSELDGPVTAKVANIVNAGQSHLAETTRYQQLEVFFPITDPFTEEDVIPENKRIQDSKKR